MVRRLVEQEQVRGLDPEQCQLEARSLPSRQRSNLLERVIATEQEPRQVAAGLSGGDRDGLQERVEHRRPGDRRVAKLGQVADLDRVAKRDATIERRQIAGDRSQQGRLARAIRPDDADPFAALRGKKRNVSHDMRRCGRNTIRIHSAPARQVSNREVLDPDDDLA